MAFSFDQYNTANFDAAKRALFINYAGMIHETPFMSLWKSPSYNKQLLAPQADQGLLSSRDLETTAQALSFHKDADSLIWMLAIIGGMSTHVMTRFIARRVLSKPLTSLPQSLLVTLGTTSHFWLGSKIVYTAVPFRFAEQVENPEGVLQALQNARYGDSALTSFASPSTSEQPQHLSQAIPDPNPNPNPNRATHQPTRQPHTQWDEIRGSKSNTATPSTWDKLRQNAERSAVQSNPDQQRSTNDDDRARAQAEFDALLEKERSMK
ncbi:hypothetical protein PQX77_004175 [Marasmius sp. AFHP31]|nr:hypothetical protein PQX77_004175 [Marasmius sp. AFHP31]